MDIKQFRNLIAKKEQQALEGKSVEELRAMLSNP